MVKKTEKTPEIRVRLRGFIKSLGISERQFEINNNFYNGFVGKINKIDAGKKAILEKTYPELNINWLITGMGDMLQSEVINHSIVMNDNTIKANNLEVSINKTGVEQSELIKKQEEEIKFLKHEIEFLKRQNKELLEMLVKNK